MEVHLNPEVQARVTGLRKTTTAALRNTSSNLSNTMLTMTYGSGSK